MLHTAVGGGGMRISADQSYEGVCHDLDYRSTLMGFDSFLQISLVIETPSF